MHSSAVNSATVKIPHVKNGTTHAAYGAGPSPVQRPMKPVTIGSLSQSWSVGPSKDGRSHRGRLTASRNRK
jgi:hypothetical protein